MPEQTEPVIDLARSVTGQFAGSSLPPVFAKLYSQHTLLGAGQVGLRRWRSDEAAARLADAVRLVEAALIQKRAGDASWNEAMLRAAELMEWLSHPSLAPVTVPMPLLASAAYQLAGYPARAAGMLAAADRRATPLASFLRGDFPALQRSLIILWSTFARQSGSLPDLEWADEEKRSAGLHRIAEDEVASAFGILCASMRWHTDDRVEAAIAKLAEVAQFMVNGDDRYSWLLAKLAAETARTFVDTALRHDLGWLPQQLDDPGKLAVERYLRQAYLSCKTQAWPSQAKGIARLSRGDSFVLCTPTGSGKTTIAEIAILQCLFSTQQSSSGVAPLIMYLVPKRALAAEVEAKLSRVIAPLSRERIVITGLYGGIDWGPTDAWLTSDERTILICTYEKAEALIRFLGPLFLERLSLVVLDEAHMIQFDGSESELRTSESRSLRLESLIARLFVHVQPEQCRIIGLSAVAAGMEAVLAKWITGDPAALPERTLYRSTRQLIGRLECRTSRGFDIRYDLLDRARLRFEETDGGSPFIPGAFPPFPPAASFEAGGPEKRLRPYLFWAAMHLVNPSSGDDLHAVLVSIPQRIGGYAQDLLDLLEGDWATVAKPVVFRRPTDPSKLDSWQRCLLACEDYFGANSREYRLLQKGIVAHHGKMPGLMARLLIQLIDQGVIHFVLATSTLSEGVNLPFEAILLPTLRRGAGWFTAREFANLAGRAGRPGFGTEGKCLVLLPAEPTDYSSKQVWRRYNAMINDLSLTQRPSDAADTGRSALAALLTALRQKWAAISGLADEEAFLNWLETTATISAVQPTTVSTQDLIETLDSLDSILLSAIVELESLADTTLSSTDLEGKLADIWRRSYAHFASQNEAMLSKWFLHRGSALVIRIYPDPTERRKLYRTGLPPRQGDQLSRLYPTIRAHMLTGVDYAARTSDDQFEYISRLVDLLAVHPRFAPATKTPGKISPRDLLRWWLDPTGPVRLPTPTQVSEWYDYVSTNFGYRLAWGIGCTLALAANEAHGDSLQPTTLESFKETGLPWIALWLKELIVWGTLDPVAAYLLGRGRAGTRAEARHLSAQFYEVSRAVPPDDQLDPRVIRKWAETLPTALAAIEQANPQSVVKATLVRTFPNHVDRKWRVLPAEAADRIRWVDPAGFELAITLGSLSLPPPEEADFVLDVDTQTVSYSSYL